MNIYLSPKQRRNQRGSVEDRWRKRVKDDDGNTVEVASAVAGKVKRRRARYVDDGGREIQRSCARKVDAQQWLDVQLASLLRGELVSPEDAKLTVGQWCDEWLVRYGTRRKPTVRTAEVHLKIIRAHFGGRAALGGQTIRRPGPDRETPGRRALRLLRLRAAFPALAPLHRRRP